MQLQQVLLGTRQSQLLVPADGALSAYAHSTVRWLIDFFATSLHYKHDTAATYYVECQMWLKEHRTCAPTCYTVPGGQQGKAAQLLVMPMSDTSAAARVQVPAWLHDVSCSCSHCGYANEQHTAAQCCSAQQCSAHCSALSMALQADGDVLLRAVLLQHM